MKYVIKKGDLYADGLRHWTDSQKLAFQFHDDSVLTRTAKQWAEVHLNTYPTFDHDPRKEELRIVKLVPKRKPE